MGFFRWEERDLAGYAIAVGILGGISMAYTLSLGERETGFSNSLLGFVFIIFSVCILRWIFGKIAPFEKKTAIPGVIFSLFLSLSLVFGKQLNVYESMRIGAVSTWYHIIVISVYLFGFVCFFLQKFSFKILYEENKATGTVYGFRTMAVFWIIIFACWIPVFLALYPGVFAYDAMEEYLQVAEGVFSTHHPLIHVLTLGGLVDAGIRYYGSANMGIAVYVIIQMLICSAIFAYSCLFVLKQGIRKSIVGFFVGMYSVFPVFPMFAVCTVKDTLFNAFFLLTLIEGHCIFSDFIGYEAEKNVNYIHEILFVISSALMMLYRNNAFYAYVLWIFSVLIYGISGKKKMKLCIIMMLLSVVIYKGTDFSMTAALKADTSENQEFLAVPIQQLARVYNTSPETFSPEERELFFHLVPEEILKVYDPANPDYTKSFFNNAFFEENKKEFFQMWVKTGMKKPFTYLNAWTSSSYGFWYPDKVIDVYRGIQMHTFTYGDSSFFAFETEPPGKRDSRLPWLEDVYRKLSLELFQQKIPGISMLFSIGFMFWVFVLCMFYSFAGREKNILKFIMMMPIFLVWLTFLVGPYALVRYVLILWFAIPIMSI